MVSSVVVSVVSIFSKQVQLSVHYQERTCYLVLGHQTTDSSCTQTSEWGRDGDRDGTFCARLPTEIAIVISRGSSSLGPFGVTHQSWQRDQSAPTTGNAGLHPFPVIRTELCLITDSVASPSKPASLVHTAGSERASDDRRRVQTRPSRLQVFHRFISVSHKRRSSPLYSSRSISILSSLPNLSPLLTTATGDTALSPFVS
jgi:hypothetical protein